MSMLISSRIAWAECYHENRGDGVFVLVPSEVPKCRFVEALPQKLAEALREHNDAHCAEERIRLRMALHAGEIHYDDHGVTAAAINLAFGLLDADLLKVALATSPGLVALIVSSWLFDEVVRHSPASNPASYRPVWVTAKETSTVAWISLPDHSYPPLEVTTPSVEPTTLSPHQPPDRTPDVVARTDELRQLTAFQSAPGQDSDTVVSSTINGTTGLGATTLAIAGLPAQPVFVGRAEEMRRLLEALDPRQAERAVIVSAVSGLAGVGKTALAVRAGHEHRRPSECWPSAYARPA